ncbi:hypothetical protein HF670_07935 [Acidithiobacillus thiooxidans]|uniref:hypothetical protein n=1 Tax=Acidithiobacillus TaxID=119977 RepID=UPI001C0684C5|nr:MULTISPECIES: hypothetical protein [Acidithiobacillus]MBU2740871.1 hypothetical protein [Acidithiobacillus albertensis]MBU2839491.1 hypothetical protein [Acidithiobacillus thiooxidans]
MPEPLPIRLSTRGCPNQAIAFDAKYHNEILHIYRADEQIVLHRYSATEIYQILQSLEKQFGQKYFPLANNVEHLGRGDERPGLGMTILQIGINTNITHAQGSSYLGPCLERLGYCEWNNKNNGIQWRLIQENISERQLLQDLVDRF